MRGNPYLVICGCKAANAGLDAFGWPEEEETALENATLAPGLQRHGPSGQGAGRPHVGDAANWTLLTSLPIDSAEDLLKSGLGILRGLGLLALDRKK